MSALSATLNSRAWRYAWGGYRVSSALRTGTRALSNYVIAMSEEVVETPYGWGPALCAYREPVRRLCLHIHGSKSEGEACLTETVTTSGGIFPVR